MAVGEKAIFCGYLVMRRLYRHARERSRVGVVGEEAIADRLRYTRRVVLVCCCHCGVNAKCYTGDVDATKLYVRAPMDAER